MGGGGGEGGVVVGGLGTKRQVSSVGKLRCDQEQGGAAHRTRTLRLHTAATRVKRLQSTCIHGVEDGESGLNAV